MTKICQKSYKYCYNFHQTSHLTPHKTLTVDGPRSPGSGGYKLAIKAKRSSQHYHIDWCDVYFQILHLHLPKISRNVWINVEGPIHFLKSFMHCCFIYHYKERCFPGEGGLNRELDEVTNHYLTSIFHWLRERGLPALAPAQPTSGRRAQRRPMGRL